MADFAHALKDLLSPLEKERWVHPINKQHSILNNPMFNDYDNDWVSIDDLIRDNDLDNPIALSNHAEIWSPTKSEDDIHPEQFKYESEKDIDPNDIIYGTRKLDGRILLSNGRHRTRALKNNGIKYMKIPIYDELINSNEILKKDYHSKDPNALKAVIRGYQYIPNYDKETQKRIRDQFKRKLQLLNEIEERQGRR